MTLKIQGKGFSCIPSLPLHQEDPQAPETLVTPGSLVIPAEWGTQHECDIQEDPVPSIRSQYHLLVVLEPQFLPYLLLLHIQVHPAIEHKPMKGQLCPFLRVYQYQGWHAYLGAGYSLKPLEYITHHQYWSINLDRYKQQQNNDAVLTMEPGDPGRPGGPGGPCKPGWDIIWT